MVNKHYRSHAEEHEDGGHDEIAEGELTPQIPIDHANTHTEGSSDAIGSALTPEAYPQLYGTTTPTAGTDGKTFWNSDEEILWLDDGSSWYKVAVTKHDDLKAVGSDDHHTAFTPTDHDNRDHSAIADTVRLDEWAAPTNNIDINDQRLISVADPSDAQDATTKTWVESNFNDYSLENHGYDKHDDIDQSLLTSDTVEFKGVKSDAVIVNAEFEADKAKFNDDITLQEDHEIYVDSSNYTNFKIVDVGELNYPFRIRDSNDNGIMEFPSNVEADLRVSRDLRVDGDLEVTGDISGSTTVDGDLEVTGSISGQEYMSYETGMTEWADGLSNEEIYRTQLQSGEVLDLDRMELRLKGGGSDSDVSVDVYDDTNSSVIDSVTAGSTNTSIDSSNSGALILFRMTNNSGSSVDANIIIRGRIT